MGGKASKYSPSPSSRNKRQSVVKSIKVVLRQEDCIIESGKPKTKIHQIDMNLLKLMLPVWYTNDVLSIEDVCIAKSVWSQILDDTSPAFLRLKGTCGFPYKSAVVWFFDMFFSRFFDMYPTYVIYAYIVNHMSILTSYVFICVCYYI